MLRTFIERPILSLVISLLLVLLGLIALATLPITQFPEIVPPSVSITTRYTGANAEVCAKSVATIIERAVNGVPGMTYMASVSNNAGVTVITVNFKVGTDPDLAAVNVQNRVTTVMDELPEEVLKAGVTTEKEVNSMLMYLNLFSTDSTVDETFVYNFADINILPELKRIDGVGYAEIMGAKDYSMRVWLKPDKLQAYGLSTDDIVEAIRGQNLEAAPGKTGESSDKLNQSTQYVLRYTGKFIDVEQYKNIVLRANPDGSILKLRDVADVEFGALSYHMDSKTDGRPSASIMLKQRPGSNARDVIQNIKKRMAYLQATTFPPGMQFNIAYDVSRFLDASIQEVLKTLLEAFVLVFLVVFIFLQDWRATLITGLSIPVALIGTFAFVQLLGFSINLLTLFALVLAIGIVVDNAIVVVEAIHAKMADTGLGPREATLESMKEIAAAIISITLVMSAVFIPVSFLSGPVGIFYRQFSLTLAIAIVISGINALTLTPALCARWLKPHHAHKDGWAGGFFNRFNQFFDGLMVRYIRMLEKFGLRRRFVVLATVVAILGVVALSKILSTGFIPTEDQGILYVAVSTPPGATVERTGEVLDQINQIAHQLPEVENVSTLAGYSLLTESAGASYGMAIINLKPWHERSRKVFEVIEDLRARAEKLQDAQIEIFPPPTVPGFGNTSGFELRLLDRSGSPNLHRLAEVGRKFTADLAARKEIANAFTTFETNFPQYLIKVDYETAARKKIRASDALRTLQALVGSYYASNFVRFGQMYKVMLQSSPEYRKTPEDILKFYVKNEEGQMVPLSAFIRLQKVFGPEQMTRFNMFNAILITGEAATGYSSGDAIRAIEEVGARLPRGFTYEWSGMTREEVISGNQAGIIFLISLVFVFLILAAQYESFMLPLAVLLSLPFGAVGSFLGLWLAGLDNNIYAQVALVMLIGLLGKNAILIVEYAQLRLRSGEPLRKAALEGALSRFRPILMTSFAFIAGLIPLVFAGGAGEMGNRTIGTSAAAGMLMGTVVGIILIPGLYLLFAKIESRWRRTLS
ncbi:MAG: efflux RND transporter permease subunit [Flavobacteriales bacterium]|nr:efflux RND transporter permease subunit [Flavobacteriales bacterium]